MKPFDELQICWDKSKAEGYVINNQKVDTMIMLRVKLERSVMFGYFWPSYFWQLLVYAALCHVIVKAWGNTTLIMTAFTGILLYIPFTTMFIKKYSSMAFQKSTAMANDIQSNVRTQYQLLSEFFVFKNRFEWIGIPVFCLIVVFIIFEWWVPGSWSQHELSALLTYLFALIVCAIAIRNENKKYFKLPMAKLKLLLSEMEEVE